MILFNFKNYLDIDCSVDFADKISRIKTVQEIVIAPSMLSLQVVAKKRRGKNVHLCAQNLDYAQRGAHTGDIVVNDLKGLGCKYVLIGHSETRHRAAPRIGESDELIAKKMRLAVDYGIIPVLCFGETMKEHDAGQAEKVVRRQLTSAFADIGRHNIRVVLAYEPVWAISSQKGAQACSSEYVADMLKTVRRIMNGRAKYSFIYGGSVNGSNVRDYLSAAGIDGVIIGKAGTDAHMLKDLAAKI